MSSEFERFLRRRKQREPMEIVPTFEQRKQRAKSEITNAAIAIKARHQLLNDNIAVILRELAEDFARMGRM